MSTCTHESMINHHGHGFFAQLSDTFHVWLQRQHDRRQLAELSVWLAMALARQGRTADQSPRWRCCRSSRSSPFRVLVSARNSPAASMPGTACST